MSFLIIMKVTAALAAGIIALTAVLLGVASAVARRSDDASERRDASITGLWSLVVFALCAAAILTLTGCSTLKYAECVARDNTSRPCN